VSVAECKLDGWKDSHVEAVERRTDETDWPFPFCGARGEGAEGEVEGE